MSKQTINIGASPNDGTGTPLRTSFDYTNQNFTELYTALGGGVGLPGATTQVIFNDGGTNLAGDAGLVYNKTTDTLTAGNATITGDLTVRTTGLILNTSGLGVGITPTSFGAGYGTIQVSGSTGAGIRMGSPTNGSFIYSDASFFNFVTETNVPYRFQVNNQIQHTIAQLGVFTWFDGAGGTRMTLNSTGLGVGVTPAAGDGSGVFKAAGTGVGTANTRMGIDTRETTSGNAAGIWIGAMNSENTGVIGSRTASGNIAFQTFNGAAWGERMRIDYLGNLILQSPTTPATLTVNGQLTVNATSNTNLRFSYRGSDGVTRTANLTLA